LAFVGALRPDLGGAREKWLGWDWIALAMIVSVTVMDFGKVRGGGFFRAAAFGSRVGVTSER